MSAIKYCLPADRRFRMLKRELAALTGGVCQRCHVRRATEMHHVTYVRYGWENLTDYAFVCHACHRALHRLPIEPANDNQLILDLVATRPANDNEEVVYEIAVRGGERQ